MTLALMGLAFGVVLGFAAGLRIGHRRGRTEFVDSMIRAAFAREDAVERGWPAARAGDGRLS